MGTSRTCPTDRRRLRIALIYNGCPLAALEAPDDRAGAADLREMICNTARVLRALGHRVTIVPVAGDLLSFARRLSRLRPDVVFNQYDDAAPGALQEMRVAALVRLLGFPLTGSPPLALGLCQHKYRTAQLLRGAGVPVPPGLHLLVSVGAVDARAWRFPLIVQPNQEHAGLGLDRGSVVRSTRALRSQVRRILREYRQPALVQRFLPGREFSVGLLGGPRLRVLPLAEADYSALPAGIPRIMSYAAKWIETSVEYQRTTVICPAQVERRLARRIGEVAVRAFRAVGGWGYGRVDIRLDEKGAPRVLDVNCNPCLDEGLGLARSAEKAGIAFPQLLRIILAIALLDRDRVVARASCPCSRGT